MHIKLAGLERSVRRSMMHSGMILNSSQVFCQSQMLYTVAILHTTQQTSFYRIQNYVAPLFCSTNYVNYGIECTYECCAFKACTINQSESDIYNNSYFMKSITHRQSFQ